MRRDTRPCSSETALRPSDRRSARMGMLKVSPQGWWLAGQFHELVAGQTQFGPEGGKVFVHQPERKFIVAGRDRRMRGEDIAVTGFGNRLLEGLALGNQFTRPFEGQESCVTFVHVPDGPGYNPAPAERVLRPRPA